MVVSWPQKDARNRIQTKNNTGFMFTNAERGVATLEILEQSSCNVFAFDLVQEHLDILYDLLPSNARLRVKLQQARFPQDFIVKDEFFSAIHCSLVFPFLTGEEIEEGLNKIFLALEKGAKLYLNVLSVYIDFLYEYVPVYQKRLSLNEKHPGLINDYPDYLPTEDRNALPQNMHVFSKEVLE